MRDLVFSVQWKISDVFEVTASGNDGNREEGAVDLDINTRWSAKGANTLVIDLGDIPQNVTGDGDTLPDKNYCHISEIAVLGAE